MTANTKDRPGTILLNISAVERDTGLSKDTLRIWERRYNFPRPLRDENGDRAYTPEQVTKLQLIKRLLDRGHRPGKIIGLDDDLLAKLAAKPADSPTPRQDIEIYLRLVKSHQARELRRHLAQAIARQGLQRFIVDTVAPLTQAVGEAWMRGEIAIFEEHLYTELMQGLIRNAITGLQSRGNAPRVLLTWSTEDDGAPRLTDGEAHVDAPRERGVVAKRALVAGANAAELPADERGHAARVDLALAAGGVARAQRGVAADHALAHDLGARADVVARRGHGPLGAEVAPAEAAAGVRREARATAAAGAAAGDAAGLREVGRGLVHQAALREVVAR